MPKKGDGAWTGAAGEANSFVFSRVKRGVSERIVLDELLLHAADARRLAERSKELAEIFAGRATYTRRDRATVVRGPIDLVNAVMDNGAPRAIHPALQGPGRDECGPALGDHAGRQRAHPVAGSR